MLCLSFFELYSRWEPLKHFVQTVSPLMLIVKQVAQSKNSSKSENKMTKK